MNNLNYEEGIKEFEINNDPDRVLKFNPSDIGLVDRAEKAMRDVQDMVDKVKSKSIEIKDNGEVTERFKEQAEYVRGINEYMRTITDELFYPGAADIVFGKQNPLSTIKGKSIFENFLNAVISTIKPYIEKENAEAQKRMQKYKDAYDRPASEKTNS